MCIYQTLHIDINTAVLLSLECGSIGDMVVVLEMIIILTYIYMYMEYYHTL